MHRLNFVLSHLILMHFVIYLYRPFEKTTTTIDAFVLARWWYLRALKKMRPIIEISSYRLHCIATGYCYKRNISIIGKFSSIKSKCLKAQTFNIKTSNVNMLILKHQIWGRWLIVQMPFPHDLLYINPTIKLVVFQRCTTTIKSANAPDICEMKCIKIQCNCLSNQCSARFKVSKS